MINIRNLTENESDLQFLMDMLYESIHIPEHKPPQEELLNSPQIKKYIEDWGRKGDRALIAYNQDNVPLGASWYRLFMEYDKGYGFVDVQTPELGIAITKQARGKGTGTLLMEKLMESAVKDGFSSLSLSVDPDNKQAVALYERLGFKMCGSSGTSWMMVCYLDV